MFKKTHFYPIAFLLGLLIITTGCQCSGITSPTCAIGESKCEGSIVKRCKSDQSGFEAINDCNGKCENGACVGGSVTCTAGETICEKNTLMRCKSDQSGYERVKECGGNEYCDQNTCKLKTTPPPPKSCTPAEKKCDGNDILLCKQDGSGFDKVTTCPQEQPCLKGLCQAAKVCTPGESKCNANEVWQCNSDGTASSKVKSCADKEFCDAGTCKLVPVCKAKERQCQGDELVECKADGTGFAAVEQCEGKCQDGKCLPVVCQVGEKQCQGQDVLICRSDRTGFEKLATCAALEACTKGECKKVPFCVAGTLKCQASDVLVCKADGSSYEKVLSCPTGQTCFNGKCEGSACKANERRCSGNTVMVCKTDRTGFTQVHSCDTAHVTTLSGTGVRGVRNGGPSTTQVLSPLQLAIHPSGDIYFVESGYNIIRKLDTQGNSSDYISGSTRGYKEGPIATAQFSNIRDVAFDAKGNLYIADQGNLRVRMVTQAGIVSTFYHDKELAPTALAFGPKGNLYIAGSNASLSGGGPKIVKVTPAGVGSTFVSHMKGGKRILIWDFSEMITDKQGNLYFTENGGYRVQKVSPTGDLTTFAGTGIIGFRNGPAAQAQFSTTRGLAFDSLGNLYVADQGNHRIRKINPAGDVSTFAGLSTSGYKDGPISSALLSTPAVLVFNQQGHLIVSDLGNLRFRKINLAGQCNAGVCIPGKVCTVGTRKCKGNDVVLCRADGSGYDKLITCPSGQTCQVDKCL